MLSILFAGPDEFIRPAIDPEPAPPSVLPEPASALALLALLGLLRQRVLTTAARA
jgi:MYXO-CTERM domain-containing protein